MTDAVYIVVKTCGGEVDATAYSTYETAVEAVELMSWQKQKEWAFDNGTVYEGDSNYETTAQIIESKVYKETSDV